MQAERQEPGPQVFSGLVGAMLWGSMSQTGELVSSDQKSRVFISFLGVLSMGHTRECHGNQGHLTTILTGEVTGNLYSPAILWAVVQGVHLHERLMSI